MSSCVGRAGVRARRDLPDIADADKLGANNNTALTLGIEEKGIEFVTEWAKISHRA